MAKQQYKSAWFCSNCGNESAKWEGRCTACGEWNTMVEERVPTSKAASQGKRGTLKLSAGDISRPQKVSEIITSQEERITLPSAELNRVLGGGLVTGSMVLVGGEPGIGKSTLVLQNILSIRKRTVLYVSGEESAMQLKMRADRIGRLSENCYIVTETSLDNIFTHIDNIQPGLVVIDSIQTIADDALESSAGSVSQVRECAARLLAYAKQSNVPIILIGHITKEGSIAGPKVLEHIVDAVLRFEGDSHQMFRILRAVKNRFGSTSELGIYEMCQRGLREVTNPGEVLLGTGNEDLSGTAIGLTMEGLRPFLIEVQALVSSAAYGTPQRSVTGFDSKRMNMLLAVLEKRVGFKLAQKDVFLNLAGGIKVNDPALDLAVISAILSSNVDMVIPRSICLTGEVGLSGEIRPVTRLEQRLLEAEKLGMQTIIIPKNNLKGIDTSKRKINIIEVARVDEAFRTLFS
ncbi:MAG: DNA repair protein RadA [Bacteroidales bacterium]|nr:DNA repair protein RadA [Bacteroidales bacterium]